MNRYSDVYDCFLSLISDCSFLAFDDEELEAELEVKLKMALGKLHALKPLEMDTETGCFSRPITDQEKSILAQAMLVEWLSQKVFNVKHMRNQMSSKDFTIFSNANFLKEMIALQQYADKELHYQLTQYNLYNLPFHKPLCRI